MTSVLHPRSIQCSGMLSTHGMASRNLNVYKSAVLALHAAESLQKSTQKCTVLMLNAVLLISGGKRIVSVNPGDLAIKQVTIQ